MLVAVSAGVCCLNAQLQREIALGLWDTKDKSSHCGGDDGRQDASFPSDNSGASTIWWVPMHWAGPGLGWLLTYYKFIEWPYFYEVRMSLTHIWWIRKLRSYTIVSKHTSKGNWWARIWTLVCHPKHTWSITWVEICKCLVPGAQKALNQYLLLASFSWRKFKKR